MIARNTPSCTWTNRTRPSARRPAIWNFAEPYFANRISLMAFRLTSGCGTNFELLKSFAQGRLIANVQASLRPVNLPHQPAQNFSWADFDESLDALLNQ